MAGYVYFFRHKNTKPVKIGMTESETVANRFTSFKTSSPYGAEVIGVIHCDKPCELEKKAHERFKAFRVNGEFFEITDEMVNSFIKSHSSKANKFEYIKTKVESFILDEAIPESEKKIASRKIDSIINETRRLYLGGHKTEPNFIHRIISVYSYTGDNPVYLTNKDLLESELLSGIDVTPRELGLQLTKHKFKKTTKRVNGKVKQVYLMYKI